MKRDMDIVRAIILAAKDADEPITAIPNITQQVFAYHVQIMQEAGLLVAALKPPESKSPPEKATILRLTWSGLDFADSITNETIWNKAKDNILKPGASWTFGVLLEYIKSELMKGFPST